MYEDAGAEMWLNVVESAASRLLLGIGSIDDWAVGRLIGANTGLIGAVVTR